MAVHEQQAQILWAGGIQCREVVVITQLQLLMALRGATDIPYLMEVRYVYVLCLNIINYPSDICRFQSVLLSIS